MQLPRWVVAAASAAQHDLAYRTNHEVEAGFVASAHGRDTGNAFVTEVAGECMRIFDNRGVIAGTDFTDRDAAHRFSAGEGRRGEPAHYCEG